MIRLPSKETLTSPRILGRVLNRLYYSKTTSGTGNSNGVDIMRENWDTLVILDACRYELIEGQSYIDGTLQAKTSRGSATNEWLRANLDGRQLHNLVYVTANPMYLNNSQRFDLDVHAVIDIGEDTDSNISEAVSPHRVTQAALTAHREYPDKRILVHYMQPHYPFIAEDAPLVADKSQGKQNIWNELVRNETEINPDAVRRAYLSNLDPVLEPLKRLIDQINGYVVISADHGNMLGERSSPIPTIEWGHPQGIYTEELVRIPWLICQEGDRNISADPPDITQKSNKEVSERLERLGYV